MADIKFCGLTRVEDTELAVALGASFVGVIFAGGPRTLTVECAGRVLGIVPAGVHRVGVFAGQPIEEIGRTAESLRLSVVQLHAASDPDRVAALRRVFHGEIWPVIRLASATLPESFVEMMRTSDGVVLDALVPGVLGGTGVVLPWQALGSQLRATHREGRIILAGGLRPENVAQALAAVEPDVVDVSSGVEISPGIKNHERMRAFRDAVTNASISS